MADEDKTVKEGQTPADPPAVEPSTQTFKQASEQRNRSAAPGGSGASSEWTVSDSRGPLSRAQDEEAARAAANDAEPAPASGPPPADTIGPKLPPDTAPAHALDPDAASGDAAKPTVGERRPEAIPPLSYPASPLSQPEPKRPLWAVAVGIVIGAAIGAGSAAFVYRSVNGDVMSDEVARLSSRVEALEKRPGAQTDSALKQNLADLQGKVDALGQSRGAAPAATDLGPLESKIAALQSGLDAVKAEAGDAKGLDAKVSGLADTINGMKTQASSAQAGVAAMQGEQKALAGKVMVPALAVVADSLVQQIDQGQPYAAQVDALAALGADPVKIAVLRQNAGTGVPSAKVLAAKFEPLAEPIAANPHPAPANAGFVDRLKSGMLGMVSVRRADDTSGSDPASRVARIKADLAHDDVAAALASWDALPGEAKARGEAWHALAKTHAEAMSAARALQHEAIAALGSKKS